MLRKTALLALLVGGGSSALLSGCNSSGAGFEDDGGTPADLAIAAQNPDHAQSPDLTQGPDLAPASKPIDAPKSKWTFVPIEGAVCDDGTPTGIGVYITDSPNLLVFLMGGGACWDYLTCVGLNTSTHGPYGQAQFDAQVGNLGGASGTVFSEDASGPFAGWSKVFIPYCTGDIHGGDKVQTYMGGGGPSTTIHHKGYSNVKLALARLGATFPAPAKLVWSGSSAGGYGAAINYPNARATWSKAKSYLIDDSGPVFIADALNPFLKKGWVPAWGLDGTLFKLCPDCVDGDWSLAYSTLVKTYPDDRMALLSSEADATMVGYLLFQNNPGAFTSALYALATMRFDPTANFRYFIEPGRTHTMLGDLTKHTVTGVNVGSWIKQMTTDDAGWKSVKP